MSELSTALGFGSCLLINFGVGFYTTLTGLRQRRHMEPAIRRIESYEARIEEELGSEGFVGQVIYHLQFPGRGAAYVTHLLQERTR